ncbi:MAG: hypothetical protein U0790_03575 [Isosphaeraceae bacterium]
MPELKKGVSGVLGGLIGSPSPKTAQEPSREVSPTVEEREKEPEEQRPILAATPKKREGRGEAEKPKARRGRPPGTGRGAEGPVERKKVTLRIKSSLIDEYIDWSWSRRCQLGQLIEEALESYGSRERRRTGSD